MVIIMSYDVIYDDFEIEELGVCEEWVYDIEVEDNHNFFANDILVHNSFYIDMEKFIDHVPAMSTTSKVDYMDSIAKKLIEPKIKEIYQEMADYIGVFENTMNMDREVISESSFWLGAKAYAMLVHDLEGRRFDPPIMKIMGIKVVRSDTPISAKGIMKQFIKKVLYSLPVGEFITGKKNSILSWGADKLNKPSSVKVLDNYFNASGFSASDQTLKGAPMAVKGAINYNWLLKEKGLTDKYPEIISGDKVFSLYLKSTNPYSFSEISFSDRLPVEFELDEYIDKLKMYETIIGKFFRDVLTSIGKDNVLSGYQDLDLF